MNEKIITASEIIKRGDRISNLVNERLEKAQQKLRDEMKILYDKLFYSDVKVREKFKEGKRHENLH